MRLAQIEGGFVVNVIEVDPGAVPDWAAGWPPAGPAGPGWTWDGTSFSPPEEAPVPVPQEVTLFQARAALLVYGAQIGRPTLLAEADALVDGLQAGDFGLSAVQVGIVREAWRTANVVRHDSPALNLLLPALDLPGSGPRDELFRLAAQQAA